MASSMEEYTTFVLATGKHGEYEIRKRRDAVHENLGRTAGVVRTTKRLSEVEISERNEMKKKKLTPKKISESVNNKFSYWLPISADNRSHHHKRECRRVQIEHPDKQPATLGHGAGRDRVVAIKADSMDSTTRRTPAQPGGFATAAQRGAELQGTLIRSTLSRTSPAPRIALAVP